MTLFPALTLLTIFSVFSFQWFLRTSLSFNIGNMRLIVSVELLTYFFIMDNAMLGLPSFEVGAKTTSAFLINLTAFIVSSSGSPGPQPTHESFIIINFKIESYLNEKTVFVVLNDIYIHNVVLNVLIMIYISIVC